MQYRLHTTQRHPEEPYLINELLKPNRHLLSKSSVNWQQQQQLLPVGIYYVWRILTSLEYFDKKTTNSSLRQSWWLHCATIIQDSTRFWAAQRWSEVFNLQTFNPPARAAAIPKKYIRQRLCLFELDNFTRISRPFLPYFYSRVFRALVWKQSNITEI